MSSFVRPLTGAAAQGVGKPVARVEDARLVTGGGRYSDDVNVPGQVYAAFVRSPHAHARIRAIDGAAASKGLGLLAVLTAADAAADGVQDMPHKPVPTNSHEVALSSRDGSPFFLTPHPTLPADRVRFVGQAVAMVVAEAVWELCAYDESGQMQAATFMDYALPRADHFPSFHCEISEVPSTTNPLGLPGGGEDGTTPALAAVINAVVDALAELGVEHIDMPATPARVWHAIQAAKRAR